MNTNNVEEIRNIINKLNKKTRYFRKKQKSYMRNGFERKGNNMLSEMSFSKYK